jgi:hypothetical protein
MGGRAREERLVFGNGVAWGGEEDFHARARTNSTHRGPKRNHALTHTRMRLLLHYT